VRRGGCCCTYCFPFFEELLFKLFDLALDFGVECCVFAIFGKKFAGLWQMV
jgi:hypothetical protein